MAILVLSGCASAAAQPLAPAPRVPTPTLRPIQFPRDNAPHDALTEWWYYTGHLHTQRGARYGFELVFFQSIRAGIPVGYVAHFAITDQQRGTFQYDQRQVTQSEPFKTFNLNVGDWTIAGSGEDDHLAASIANYGINLLLHPVKPPALHGGTGIISFGPVGDSYYYSDTRIDVSGTIVDHGQSSPVTGIAWKDRQWGNFLVLPNAGWDWFSIQFDDGVDLMLFVLRGPAMASGEGNPPAYGTLVAADGRATNLAPGDATVKVTNHWTSPHTGTVYPSGWTVDLASQDLNLTITPVLADQELDTRKTTGNVYWEGAVRIEGTRGKDPAPGVGYVELTGYAH